MYFLKINFSKCLFFREKNGTDVRKVKELEGRFRILAAERKFIIERTEIHDDGLYSCVANNQKKDINVIGRLIFI